MQVLRATRTAAEWRAARVAAGWSQFELAKRSGLHLATVSLAERGAQIAPATAAKLAQALGLPTTVERQP